MLSKKKKFSGKKFLKVLLTTIGIFLGIIIVAGGLFIYNNLNYYKAPMRAVWKAGFQEKQAILPDGSVMNYGEGGRGIPLMLIHGQGVSWEDYMDVLPQLSKYYHIYAVDCYGHGQSSSNPEKYTAKAIGADFIWFIENVIREPAVVSGHSSGGLLTAWLGANSPENVKGVVLEDPPFFSCEAERTEKSFAWLDSFVPAHNFLNQSVTDDYPLYYLENCKWITYFGNGREGIINYAKGYRKKHTDEPLKFFYLPPSITRMFYFLDGYDPKFGNAFYDCTWMEDFDHAETIAKIKCPSILIHTNWSYDAEGVLLAAMSGDDAKKACSLIDGCKLINIKSGHDSHAEKPKEFIMILIGFLDDVK